MKPAKAAASLEAFGTSRAIKGCRVSSWIRAALIMLAT
jgi:hypothetical protein